MIPISFMVKRLLFSRLIITSSGLNPYASCVSVPRSIEFLISSGGTGVSSDLPFIIWNSL